MYSSLSNTLSRHPLRFHVTQEVGRNLYKIGQGRLVPSLQIVDRCLPYPIQERPTQPGPFQVICSSIEGVFLTRLLVKHYFFPLGGSSLSHMINMAIGTMNIKMTYNNEAIIKKLIMPFQDHTVYVF